MFSLLIQFFDSYYNLIVDSEENQTLSHLNERFVGQTDCDTVFESVDSAYASLIRISMQHFEWKTIALAHLLFNRSIIVKTNAA